MTLPPKPGPATRCSPSLFFHLRELLAIAVIIVCTPFSLLLLFLWLLQAAAMCSVGVDVGPGDLADALFVDADPRAAWFIFRQQLGLVGGLAGWPSLIALAAMPNRPWSRVPRVVKAGCGLGVVGAIGFPLVAPGLFLPPVLLCAALVWQARQRDDRG